MIALTTPIAMGEGRTTHSTMQESVYRALRQAILSGKFIPGRSVTLRGVASMLDVSVTPVREALRQLVAEHALEALDNRRVRVPHMDQARLEEICAARIALETRAALRALPHVDSPCIARLWELNTQIDDAIERGDVEAYLQRHYDFHFTLYGAAPSRVLIHLIESVWLQFSPFLSHAINHVETDYLKDRHAEALHALETRNPDVLRFAIEADIREGLGALREEEWDSAGQRRTGDKTRGDP